MVYLFNNYETTYRMICGSYKKLKSQVYYDKSAFSAKAKIAEFESDRDQFLRSLSNLSYALVNQDNSYFGNLIKDIDFFVLPKKFESDITFNDTVQGYSNHCSNLKNVNFFINLPIELYILDFLWTLLLGKVLQKSKNYFRYAAATRFKPSIFFHSDDNLYSGVDFDSNRSFIPYFDLYKEWRNGAFKKIRRVHADTSTALICLDIKSFYYSVEFDFTRIIKYLDYDVRVKYFEFLTYIIEQIYNKYTNIICQFKKGILNKKDKNVFPIGLVSTFILRELYLNSFDKRIEQYLRPLYYQRYVDDVLLVVDATEKETLNKEEAIKQYLVDTGIVTLIKDRDISENIRQDNSDNSRLKMSGYHNLFIQQNKVNHFVFPKNEQTLLLDVYEEYIEQNSSITGMLPDFDILKTSFRKSVYTLKNFETSNKIRDIGFLQSNNYNATRYIVSLMRLLKDTKNHPDDVRKVVEQIIEFYRGSQCIEFSNNWSTIFELLITCHFKEYAKEFYLTVKENINSLNMDKITTDDLFESRKNIILNGLKDSLQTKLDVAISIAAVHDNYIIDEGLYKLVEQFRKSNMFNHNLISNALENYTDVITSKSLRDENPSSLLGCFRKFDYFCIMWTPRFIHISEIYIALLRICLNNSNNINLDPDEIFEFYDKCNNLMRISERPKFSKDASFISGIETHSYLFNSDVKPNPKIALVNTRITEADVEKSIINPNYALTFSNKEKLYKIINMAKEENATTIVFPEYYFPLRWLPEVLRFATKFNITIITGLSLIITTKNAYNIVCALVPIGKKRNYKTGLMILREKNFYTPKEKIVFSKYNLKCNNASPVKYYICDNGFYKFGTILCYEFTEIASRTHYKEQVEVLFIPQLNKDTNYFSAIVESAARDLHCFIIQANTSDYGDSRITAPYKTLFKNILQVKGGENDVVLTATIDTQFLKEVRETFDAKVNLQMKVCNECTEEKNYEKCEICKRMVYKDDFVKFPAPRI